MQTLLHFDCERFDCIGNLIVSSFCGLIVLVVYAYSYLFVCVIRIQ